jgi:hypothetical protein
MGHQFVNLSRLTFGGPSVRGVQRPALPAARGPVGAVPVFASCLHFDVTNIEGFLDCHDTPLTNEWVLSGASTA